MYNDYNISDCCCCNYNGYANSLLTNAWLGIYCFDNTQKLTNTYNSMGGNFEIQKLQNELQSLSTTQCLSQQTQSLKSAISNSSWCNPNYMSMAPIYAPNCFCYSALNRNISQIEYKEEKRLTIEELDLLLFPNDPIRDWIKKEIKRIEKKYKWIEEIR